VYKVVKCGFLVTGDGKTFYKNKALWIKDGKFIDITNFDTLPMNDEIELILTENALVAPGAINHHTHGCVTGPLFPSGAPSLSEEKVIYNLNRHLRQGTTTVCNVCGFPLMEEVQNINQKVPVHLYLTSAHTPSNIKAAEIVDGQGLTVRHKRMTVRQMIEAGAVAVGEIGGGHTLGGGGQDYLYIPQAIAAKIGGKNITPDRARELKFAVLGRYLNFESSNQKQISKLIREYNLEGKITPQEIITIIRQCVMPSVATALSGYEEAFDTAWSLKMPLILHNSAPSVKKIEELLLKNSKKVEEIAVIAAHCDHDTFEVEESVKWAERLKKLGAIIDLATFDITLDSQQKTGGSPKYFDVLAESGLMDIISTDYNNGNWDGIYKGIGRIIKKGYLNIPQAIALGTGNVRKIFPHLAQDRGLIQKGLAADFIITDFNDIAQIRQVFIKGECVYDSENMR